MICKTCTFRTKRLLVKEWHSICEEALDSTSLVQVVESILAPKVTAYLPEHWHDQARNGKTGSWISERDEEGAILLVVKTSTNTPIGFLTLFESNNAASDHQEVRLGYVLAESAWGQGIATELVAGFIAWCRAAGISKVVAGVSAENPASVRVLEKCGFTKIKPEESLNSSVQFFELRIALKKN